MNCDSSFKGKDIHIRIRIYVTRWRLESYSIQFWNFCCKIKISKKSDTQFPNSPGTFNASFVKKMKLSIMTYRVDLWTFVSVLFGIQQDFFEEINNLYRAIKMLFYSTNSSGRTSVWKPVWVTFNFIFLPWPKEKFSWKIVKCWRELGSFVKFITRPRFEGAKKWLNLTRKITGIPATQRSNFFCANCQRQAHENVAETSESEGLGKWILHPCMKIQWIEAPLYVRLSYNGGKKILLHPSFKNSECKCTDVSFQNRKKAP